MVAPRPLPAARPPANAGDRRSAVRTQKRPSCGRGCSGWGRAQGRGRGGRRLSGAQQGPEHSSPGPASRAATPRPAGAMPPSALSSAGHLGQGARCFLGRQSRRAPTPPGPRQRHRGHAPVTLELVRVHVDSQTRLGGRGPSGGGTRPGGPQHRARGGLGSPTLRAAARLAWPSWSAWREAGSAHPLVQPPEYSPKRKGHTQGPRGSGSRGREPWPLAQPSSPGDLRGLPSDRPGGVRVAGSGGAAAAGGTSECPRATCSLLPPTAPWRTAAPAPKAVDNSLTEVQPGPRGPCACVTRVLWRAWASGVGGGSTTHGSSQGASAAMGPGDPSGPQPQLASQLGACGPAEGEGSQGPGGTRADPSGRLTTHSSLTLLDHLGRRGQRPAGAAPEPPLHGDGRGWGGAVTGRGPQ